MIAPRSLGLFGSLRLSSSKLYPSFQHGLQNSDNHLIFKEQAQDTKVPRQRHLQGVRPRLFALPKGTIIFTRMDSQQEFFTNLEVMLTQEATAPRNCLIPFFYLHLLSLPQYFWDAPDLLRFPDEVAWQDALGDIETLTALTLRLTQYENIWPGYRELVLYFQAQAHSFVITPYDEEVDEERETLNLTPTDALSLLEYPSFRGFLTDQMKDNIKQDPWLKTQQILTPELLSIAVNWSARGLFEQSLTTLAQHGWIDVLPASPGNDLLIRLKRFPAQPTTETSKNPQPHSVTL